MGGNVVVIENDAEWKAKVTQAAADGKTVVVDFTATWCGPCRMIAPVFEALSGQFPGLVFLKVDVDKCSGAAAECGISAMPTFQVWKDGQKVEEMVGAKKETLEALVAKYA